MNFLPGGVYLSFPSSKNSNSHSHTAEIIDFIDYEIFSKWKGQRWKNRDSEYEKLKGNITENLIHFVDQNLPGFSQLIDYMVFLVVQRDFNFLL